MVAGEPLSYHWFIYAMQAHLIDAPGVDRIDTVFRLMPVLLVPVLVSLAAVVARQLAGAGRGRSPGGGADRHRRQQPADPLGRPQRSPDPLERRRRFARDTHRCTGRTARRRPSGWVAGVACLGLAVAFIRRAPEDRIAPAWLLVPFMVLAVGAKSSQLPVVRAPAWRWPGWSRWSSATGLQARRAGVVLLGALVVFGVALQTIYSAGSYGLIVRPLGGWPWSCRS